MMQTNDSNPINRRSALAAVSGFAAGAALSGAGTAHAQNHDKSTHGLLTADELGFDSSNGTYSVPPLPYEASALNEAIDERTMLIHHDRHHAGYVKGLNTTLDALKSARRGGDTDASRIGQLSRDLSFHGSGHVNHTLFWMTMAPADGDGGGTPSGEIAKLIGRDFGSFDAFKSHFTAAASTVRGSGWAWLALEPAAKMLIIHQMENQEELSLHSSIPLLGVDVWEHAYYLRYQNNRGEYIKNWWNVVNWKKVDELAQRVL